MIKRSLFVITIIVTIVVAVGYCHYRASSLPDTIPEDALKSLDLVIKHLGLPYKQQSGVFRDFAGRDIDGTKVPYRIVGVTDTAQITLAIWRHRCAVVGHGSFIILADAQRKIVFFSGHSTNCMPIIITSERRSQ